MSGRTAITDNRRGAMLRSAFGPAIGAALADSSVIEVLANPDGAIWIERLGVGRQKADAKILPHDVERIIRLVASTANAECRSNEPIVSAELPETGERFEGLLPPVSSAPCFAIRKPAQLLYTLVDYVRDRIITYGQAQVLREAVSERRNIVIAGGAGSGKTTLVNALLDEIASAGDRVVILEDTRELVCSAEDCVALRTTPGIVSLRDLVKSTLRLRPDRIIIGETRGGEALDLLKAWNTGHPGGIATIHANSAEAALTRLEQLVAEAVAFNSQPLIAEAVDLVAFIARTAGGRRLEKIVRVEGCNKDGTYRLKPVAGPEITIVQTGD